MAEPLRLRLARVVVSEPVRRYATVAELPARCPREGCGGLLREFFPVGRICAACARTIVVDELLNRRRGGEGVR